MLDSPPQIIDGTPADAGDLATVGLAYDAGTVYCSGTLVSPRIVVTAAHCVAKLVPPRVFVGRDPSVDGVFVEVIDAIVHPSYAPPATAADIAIVVLARALPITPRALPARALVPDDLAGGARFVGFGVTAQGLGDEGEVGIKYARHVPVNTLDADWLGYDVVACHGDSGGSTVMRVDGREVLAGVISRGDPRCSRGGYSTRVDRFAAWIEAQIVALDPPICSLDTRCASNCATLDPDCGVPASAPAVATDGCDAGGAGSLAPAIGVLAALLRRRRGLLGMLVIASGCASTPDEEAGRSICHERTIGDPAAPIELAIIELPHAVTIRAANLDGCAVAAALDVTLDDGAHVRLGRVLELDETGAADSAIEHYLMPIPDAAIDAVLTVEDARGRWGAVRWQP